VRTFDLGQHGDEYFLTMEYIDGRSLAQLLDDGPVPVDEVVRIARGVAAGIAAAHATGVLHRDLKPDNVLVARAGRIVITDFGIAHASTSPIRTGEELVGTPAYMAPEQLESGAEIGPRADIYAFGAILFELLTGRRPFVGEGFQVALARLHQAPPDPRSLRPVPDALAELALRCLARAPADRFADGESLAAALAALQHLDVVKRPAPRAAAVPAKTSRSVAILPLRASGELAEIAEGLSEEIVDALSMSRSLRVRPLVSVRKIAAAEPDPREVGKALGVEVVVDGSIRRRGDAVRIAARAIGVDDGFQLWASHFDTGPEGLLATSDEVVRAIARALTVELDLPDRARLDPRAAERYLEFKAKLRASWIDGTFPPIIAGLEQALALEPDDAGILATLALAEARAAFYGDHDRLASARAHADRAVELAPSSGDAWLARGVSRIYGGATAEAATALRRALACAPGLTMAQSLLGAIALEAGALDDAIAHLEAARSIDPAGLHRIDLPRAYVYAGRWEEAMRELDRTRTHPEMFGNRAFDEVSIARFEMWRGNLYALPPVTGEIPASFRRYHEIAEHIHRTGVFSAEDRAALSEVTLVANPRLRASRCQFMAEFLMLVGDDDEALRLIGVAVDAGLQDHAWMTWCPMLARLRPRPEFATLAGRVAERSQQVLASFRADPTERA